MRVCVRMPIGEECIENGLSFNNGIHSNGMVQCGWHMRFAWPESEGERADRGRVQNGSV